MCLLWSVDISLKLLIGQSHCKLSFCIHYGSCVRTWVYSSFCIEYLSMVVSLQICMFWNSLENMSSSNHGWPVLASTWGMEQCLLYCYQAPKTCTLFSLTLEACFKSLNSGLCFRVDAEALKTSRAPPITTMPPAFKKQEGKVCADHIEPACCDVSRSIKLTIYHCCKCKGYQPFV